MKTRVWFNLHLRMWSAKRGGAPVRHLSACRLIGVSFRVSERARQRVVARRCREVHAYAVGSIAPPVSRRAGVPVSYNPYRGPLFYRQDNGAAVVSADEVRFLSNGECFAINPKGASK